MMTAEESHLATDDGLNVHVSKTTEIHHTDKRAGIAKHAKKGGSR